MKASVGMRNENDFRSCDISISLAHLRMIVSSVKAAGSVLGPSWHIGLSKEKPLMGLFR